MASLDSFGNCSCNYFSGLPSTPSPTAFFKYLIHKGVTSKRRFCTLRTYCNLMQCIFVKTAGKLQDEANTLCPNWQLNSMEFDPMWNYLTSISPWARKGIEGPCPLEVASPWIRQQDLVGTPWPDLLLMPHWALGLWGDRIFQQIISVQMLSLSTSTVETPGSLMMLHGSIWFSKCVWIMFQG